MKCTSNHVLDSAYTSGSSGFVALHTWNLKNFMTPVACIGRFQKVAVHALITKTVFLVEQQNTYQQQK